MLKVTNSLFNKFKSSFPFCCIDLILVKGDEFLLVKRTIPPYKGKLCLPGGIIRRGEKINSAIKRIGKEELGVHLEIIQTVGFYEKIYQNRHDVTHCFIVRIKTGELTLDYQANHAEFFKNIPKGTADFFRKMLVDAGFS